MSNLIASSLVKRAAGANDGRRAILSLTAKGRRAYEQILLTFQQRQQTMLSGLLAAERGEFDRLLNKLMERSDEWAQGES